MPVDNRDVTVAQSLRLLGGQVAHDLAEASRRPKTYKERRPVALAEWNSLVS
jgi:hypothetical protein